uniref:lipoprotein n=1 Tax=Acidithiobacillus thiooxidans TaxID=930 RepID=UPI00026249AA
MRRIQSSLLFAGVVLALSGCGSTTNNGLGPQAQNTLSCGLGYLHAIQLQGTRAYLASPRPPLVPAKNFTPSFSP